MSTQSNIADNNSICIYAESSTERMKKTSDAMTDQIVCLLCSPPGSGKTVFARTFKNWLSTEQNKTVIYISLSEEKGISSGLKPSSTENASTFGNYWTTKIGKTWEECIDGTDQMDILIDDVHVIGKNVLFFWDKLKSLINGRKKKRVLLLSRDDTQHIVSSFGIQKTFGLEHLRFTRAEYDSLCNAYISGYPFLEQKFGNMLLCGINDTDPPLIYGSTRGHPGLVSSSFQFLVDKGRKENFTIENLFLVLISREYKEYITNTVPYVMLQDWSLASNEIQFLLKVLSNLDDESRLSLDSIEDNNKEIMVNKFLGVGLLVKIDEKLELVAPMMRDCLWDLVNTN